MASVREKDELLHNPSTIIFLISRVTITLASQMLTIAVGWQMYEVTKSTFYLGLIGLVQFLPMFLLTLVVGYVVDRFDRKIIVCVCQVVECLIVSFLAFYSFHGGGSKESILIIAFFIGATGAFQGPSIQSMLPNIVSKEEFPRAAALSSSVFQFAVILGPAIGGVMYVLGAGAVYTTVAVLALINSIMILFIRMTKSSSKAEPVSMKSLLGGISFIKSKPEILGAISLDLFAVLFGGATALLPVYASTILHIGSWGLGLLRSAPAAGALIVSALLARKPISTKVGYKMYSAVAVFGLATILFAVSKSFYLSLAALIIMGGADVFSVVIRSTLVQMGTPDSMRGRVSSVNSLFIGTSNQLGEFESGLTSTWFGGVVPAVIVGGVGTLAVVLLWTKLFPGLFHTDKYEYI